MITNVINVENFVDSLVLGTHRALAGILFQTEQQCRDFYIGFLGRNQHIIDDLLDYRENRLSMADISIDKFMDMCDNKDKQEVFEQTFLQPFTIADMEIINKSIENNTITLAEIFANFQGNFNKNIMQYVL